MFVKIAWYFLKPQYTSKRDLWHCKQNVWFFCFPASKIVLVITSIYTRNVWKKRNKDKERMRMTFFIRCSEIYTSYLLPINWCRTRSSDQQWTNAIFLQEKNKINKKIRVKKKKKKKKNKDAPCAVMTRTRTLPRSIPKNDRGSCF